MTQPISTAPLFRIRNARRGDAEAVRTLLMELGYPHPADSQTVAWVVSHPEMELFVATDTHDKPIGLLSLSHRPQLRLGGRIATIDEMVVSKAWQRKGVGKALIQKALERAKVLTVHRWELHTSNARGSDTQAFYQACGFTRVDSSVMRFTALEKR